jgi:flavin-dependent dehydrogenase
VYSPYRHSRLPAHLHAFITQHPDLAGARAGKPVGFPIPTANQIGRFQDRRIWLIGDAAGLPEPLLGEGIYFALRSGALAARLIIEAGVNATAGCFDALMQQRLVPDLQMADRMARLLYRLPGFVLRRLFRDATMRSVVIDLLTGDTAYRDVPARLLQRAPGWLSGLARYRTRPAE